MAMNQQLKIIASMVKTLGTDSFDDNFFNFFNKVVGISQCTVFEFTGKESARIILAVGVNPAVDKTAKSLAYDYIHGFFRHDPNVSEVSRDFEDDEAFLSHFELDEIEDDNYRKKFYDQAYIAHEVNFKFPFRDHTIIASLYRSHSQGPFTDQETSLLADYVDLSLQLLRKHIELIIPKYEQNKDTVERQYQQLLTLLASFNLSPREMDICALILLGYTTNGIALKLEITVNTVATHRKRAYAKMGISTQNELFCRCFEVLRSHPII